MAVTPAVVIFDLGNVLIPWDRRFLFEKVIDDPDELEFFLNHVLTLEANARLDAGTPLPLLCDQLTEQFPDHAYELSVFRDRWPETVTDAIAGSVELLDRLRRTSVRLLALSNWGADTFEMAKPNYHFLDWFEGLVISGREGVVKPGPEIFELLCERHSVEPETALFVDDSTANIAAARKLGFQTHLFTDPAPLEADLIERGLLSPSAS